MALWQQGPGKLVATREEYQELRSKDAIEEMVFDDLKLVGAQASPTLASRVAVLKNGTKVVVDVRQHISGRRFEVTCPEGAVSWHNGELQAIDCEEDDCMNKAVWIVELVARKEVG